MFRETVAVIPSLAVVAGSYQRLATTCRRTGCCVSASRSRFRSVVLPQHIGGSANEALERVMALALLNVTQVLEGAAPISRVN
jgi:hypothetical protein